MISPDKLQKAIFAAAGDQSQDAIHRVALAGQDVLYGKSSPIFDDIMSGEGDIGEKIGNGVSNLLLVLFDKGQGKVPKGALLPAGAILISRVAELADKTNPVDDTTFSTALQVFSVRVLDKFDKTFRGKVAAKTGKQPQEEPQQEPQAQPAGLINRAAGG